MKRILLALAVLVSLGTFAATAEADHARRPRSYQCPSYGYSYRSYRPSYGYHYRSYRPSYGYRHYGHRHHHHHHGHGYRSHSGVGIHTPGFSLHFGF